MNRSDVARFVRRQVMDFPETNALLENEELSEEVIEQCITMALFDFNISPPVITAYTVDTHPVFPLLVWGTMIEMLTSAGILNSRNRLTYQAGNVQVNVSDKAGEYSNWIRLLMQRYETLKASWKKSMNINACYGSVPSQYQLINIGLDYNLGALNSYTLDSIF